ncbi:uncharacterized protein TM35_000351320 [Trypanosoma theileri]|uniref:Uncharacterized protein n=1 Tax=Trypanosoma theileri TaxID=67003 RepID=A0A1X0NLH4_9TRYP|nr:uncharacterized protein TM35_000351320 [Trypanosoma theileri]ORC85388.1 hypothetical protein TM35_000351320 [Trypanosoma theileri]
MSVSVDMRHVAARTRAAARRRRQRLLSAGDNGAIVEYDSFTTFTSTSPSHRIPVPPRQALTRPLLFDYYKVITGKEPGLMQRDLRKEGYSYSWFTPASSEEREVIPKGKRRLGEALIAARKPLCELEEGVRGVFDSGHIYSPIFRSLSRNSGKKTILRDNDIDGKEEEGIQEEEDDYDDNNINTKVVFVRPVARELLSKERMMYDEMVRVAPKGREWDRQHALRHEVGRTAQEALIDSHIDTRYRRPGDYVRRNWRGDLLDARGRPMRVVSTLI